MKLFLISLQHSAADLRICRFAFWRYGAIGLASRLHVPHFRQLFFGQADGDPGLIIRFHETGSGVLLLKWWKFLCDRWHQAEKENGEGEGCACHDRWCEGGISL